jgi:hypothetical protein
VKEVKVDLLECGEGAELRFTKEGIFIAGVACGGFARTAEIFISYGNIESKRKSVNCKCTECTSANYCEVTVCNCPNCDYGCAIRYLSYILYPSERKSERGEKG